MMVFGEILLPLDEGKLSVATTIVADVRYLYFLSEPLS